MKLNTRQKGLSPIGVLFMSLMFASFVFIVLKIIPAYTSYNTLVDIFDRVANDSSKEGNPGKINSAIRKQIQLNSINGFELSEHAYIEKEGEKLFYGFEYEVREPIVGNIEVLITFSHSNEEEGE